MTISYYYYNTYMMAEDLGRIGRIQESSFYIMSALVEIFSGKDLKINLQIHLHALHHCHELCRGRPFFLEMAPNAG